MSEEMTLRLVEKQTRDAMDLAKEILDQAVAQQHQLCDLGYPDRSQKALIGHALRLMATFAVRLQRATTLLLESGWAPESMPLIRATWECATDMGYLLAGAGRSDRAVRYLGMTVLRRERVLGFKSPEKAEERYPEFIAQIRAKHGEALHLEELERELGKDPGVRANHWSGKQGLEVRRLGSAYIAEALEVENEKLFDSSDRLLFVAGSQISHADPAAVALLPGKTHKEAIEPSSDRILRQVYSTCYAALQVVAPVEAWLSGGGKAEKALELQGKFVNMSQRHDAEDEKADSRKE